ncbi:MAG: MFS transporter [candidate division WOR-3 bacterium]
MASRLSLPRTFAALAHRNYRLYWFGNLVSLIGTWIQSIATGWLVLQLSNSAFFVGLNSTLTWLPAWFMSLPGGALADHFNKRNLMIVTQSVLALFALLLAVLTWTRVITIYHLLVISCLSGFVVTMNAPIVQSMIPELVNGKDVLNAVALNSTMFNTARIIGPSIAGVLLTTVGAGACFGINSASFLAVIIPLLFVRLESPARSPNSETMWQRIRQGLGFVAHHPDIRVLIIMVAVFSSFGIIYLPLMPVFARDVFLSGPKGYGILMSSVGIGAVVGGLTIATISRTRHKGWILTYGTLALALLIFGFSFIRDMHLATVVLVLIGFCQTTVASLSNTLIQTLAPDNVRGRVMSVFTLSFNGMFPLGSLVGGAVAQKFGAPASTLVGGCVVLASLVAVSLLRPQIRRL